eukprot:TRINITY_DN7293_c0_g2_i6.p1 TRINITY_DN7293_c0_g2~~TRINITY_DN7293_c0_g2_i6.p1  ORF type:complete len:392 (-),score=34.11 TRINITY_DN7293_c0_g2_i6:258-1433(-)
MMKPGRKTISRMLWQRTRNVRLLSAVAAMEPWLLVEHFDPDAELPALWRCSLSCRLLHGHLSQAEQDYPAFAHATQKWREAAKLWTWNHRLALEALVCEMRQLQPSADWHRLGDRARYDHQERLLSWDLSGCNLRSLPGRFGFVRVQEDLKLRDNMLGPLPDSFRGVRVGGTLLLSDHYREELPDCSNVRYVERSWLRPQLPEFYANQCPVGVVVRFITGWLRRNLPEFLDRLVGPLWAPLLLVLLLMSLLSFLPVLFALLERTLFCAWLYTSTFTLILLLAKCIVVLFAVRWLIVGIAALLRSLCRLPFAVDAFFARCTALFRRCQTSITSGVQSGVVLVKQAVASTQAIGATGISLVLSGRLAAAHSRTRRSCGRKLGLPRRRRILRAV